MPITHSLELSINVLSNCGAHFFNFDLDALPEASKWLLIFGMLLGRLEFLSVIVLLTPVFWKR